MKATKSLYWFGGVLGVIFLGAIANGVWAGILSPMLGWLADRTVQSFSLISAAYKNGMYREAAKGFNESCSIDVYMLFRSFQISVLFFFVVYWYFFVTMHWTTRSSVLEVPTFITSERALSFFTSKRAFFLVSFIALVFIVHNFVTTAKSLYIHGITTRSLNSIDVIAPFIEQKEYLLLKSDFLRIKNVDDYEAFYRKMTELGRKHEIELPLREPL